VSYATPDQFTAWTSHLTDLDVPDVTGEDPVQTLQNLLDRASADIDAALCWPLPPDPPDPDDPLLNMRIPASGLSRYEQQALARANVAQAVYRCERGDDELAFGQPDIVSVSGIAFAQVKPEPIGGETFLALSGAPALWWYRSGTVTPDPPPDDSAPQ
jgi:hypothetical protein